MAYDGVHASNRTSYEPPRALGHANYVVASRAQAHEGVNITSVSTWTSMSEHSEMHRDVIHMKPFLSSME